MITESDIISACLSVYLLETARVRMSLPVDIANPVTYETNFFLFYINKSLMCFLYKMCYIWRTNDMHNFTKNKMIFRRLFGIKI